MIKNKGFKFEIIISIIIFILGIYIPYFSFYSGPFFEWFFLILLCFGVTFNTFLNVLDKKWSGKYRFIPLFFCSLGTIIAFSIFYVEQSTFEKIDWEINGYKRKKIVSEILNNQLKIDNRNLIQLHTFISLSNGGNQISIRKCNSGITVKFWIDRGLLDNHSEFVFSNCPEDISKIKEILKGNKNDEKYRKIEANWYRLNNYE